MGLNENRFSRRPLKANSRHFTAALPVTAQLLLSLTLLPSSLSLAQPFQCTIAPTVTNTMFVSWNATAGKHYDIQTAAGLAGVWSNAFNPPETFTAVSNMLGSSLPVAGAVRFFRIAQLSTNNVPPGMALVPAGSFTMGDTFTEGAAAERPTHKVYVSGFYMDRYEVTKALWDTVKTWADTNGYALANGAGKAADHPVQSISWYNMVRWCNARSQMESRTPAYYTDESLTTIYKTEMTEPYVKWDSGYRLPTEAEWEKGARGGASGHRFPWSDVDTISHNQANFYSNWTNNQPGYSYDLSTTEGYHTNYFVGAEPYTAPVGSFAPNGYGIYDMAGNIWEWCWDWYRANYYSSSPGTNPHGYPTGVNRVGRGGGNDDYAGYCRVASRYFAWDPATQNVLWGFRAVLPVGQP
jgi:formylglycine-generating enzyme required for sulfatase activity